MRPKVFAAVERKSLQRSKSKKKKVTTTPLKPSKSGNQRKRTQARFNCKVKEISGGGRRVQRRCQQRSNPRNQWTEWSTVATAEINTQTGNLTVSMKGDKRDWDKKGGSLEEDSPLPLLVAHCTGCIVIVLWLLWNHSSKYKWTFLKNSFVKRSQSLWNAVTLKTYLAFNDPSSHYYFV